MSPGRSLASGAMLGSNRGRKRHGVQEEVPSLPSHAKMPLCIMKYIRILHTRTCPRWVSGSYGNLKGRQAETAFPSLSLCENGHWRWEAPRIRRGIGDEKAGNPLTRTSQAPKPNGMRTPYPAILSEPCVPNVPGTRDLWGRLMSHAFKDGWGRACFAGV